MSAQTLESGYHSRFCQCLSGSVEHVALRIQRIVTVGERNVGYSLP